MRLRLECRAAACNCFTVRFQLPPSHRVAVGSSELKRLGFCILLLICTDIGGQCLLACQCGHPGQAEEYARSAAVFRGTVIGISQIPHLLLGARFHLADLFCTTNPAEAVPIGYLLHGIRVELEVEGIWKGEHKKRATVRTGAGGGDCGYPFELGKQYLVYASSYQDQPGRFYSSTCSRTGTIESSRSDLESLGPPKYVPTLTSGSVSSGYQLQKFKLERRLSEWISGYLWNSDTVRRQLAVLGLLTISFFAIRHARRIARHRQSDFPRNLIGWNWLIFGSIICIRAILELGALLDGPPSSPWNERLNPHCGYLLFGLVSCGAGWSLLKKRLYARWFLALVAVPVLSFCLYFAIVLSQLDEISNFQRLTVVFLFLMAGFSFLRLPSLNS